MKTRPKHVSSTSKKRREYNSETIPIDLIIEILWRLPAKSVTRFRCVSKLWDSITLRPHFTELFLTSSWSHPKLLFSCEKNGELFFFSSPQTQNPNVNSSVVRADRLTRFRFDGSCRIGSSVSGLVCVTQLRIVKGRKETVPVICNPSMVKSLLLPKVKTTRVGVNCFFGYDPIEKQFKVLSMTSRYYRRRGISKDHQVLTLGTQKHSWRMIECYIPHDLEYHGICIDGGLYYQATLLGPPTVYVIVCFDLRSEKFMFINKPQEMEPSWCYLTLVNYKGKLGVLLSDGVYTVTRGRKCFELWVLEDAKTHEWSKHIFVLPSGWKNVAGETTLFFVGMTGTNEIVLSHYLLDPCYVFYYNTEMKTIRRVEIQGMDAFKNCRLHISLNHVDNLKL